MKPAKLSHFGVYIEELARTKSRYTVFDNFLTMVICCLSIGRKEDEYFQAIAGYSKEEIDLFCKAFASVVMEMEQNPLSDPFGGYFEEYLSHGKNGQFFTPESVSDLMAELVYSTKEGEEKGNNKINDPACGSGRLLLSYAKMNRKMYFVGCDISAMCCKMTLINLCLNSLNGEVHHMDTLNMEVWRSWLVIVDPLTKIPVIYEVEKEKESSPSTAAAITEEKKEIQIPVTAQRKIQFMQFTSKN